MNVHCYGFFFFIIWCEKKNLSDSQMSMGVGEAEAPRGEGNSSWPPGHCAGQRSMGHFSWVLRYE